MPSEDNLSERFDISIELMFTISASQMDAKTSWELTFDLIVSYMRYVSL